MDYRKESIIQGLSLKANKVILGMGKNQLKRLLREESKWVDKSATKHKHSYKIPIVVRITYGDGRVWFYSAIRCEYCNSFKNAKYLGIENIYPSLPLLCLYRSHKTIGIDKSVLEK